MQYYVSTPSGQKRIADGIEKINLARSGIWFTDRFFNSRSVFSFKVGEQLTIVIEGFITGSEAIDFLLAKSSSADPTAVIYYGESVSSLTQVTVSVNTDLISEEPLGGKFILTLKEAA